MALRLMGLGWFVASCILMGVLGGIWLDTWMNVSPLFTLLGAILGSVIAFYGLYKMIGPIVEQTNKNTNDK